MAETAQSDTPPPGREAGAEFARDTARVVTGTGRALADGVQTTVNTGSRATEAVASGEASEDAREAGEHAGGVIGGMNWRQILFGLLGVGGAWLVSSMFGGGWLGTIGFALLAIPGFLMGRQLGGGSSEQASGTGTQRSTETPERERQVAPPAPQLAPPVRIAEAPAAGSQTPPPLTQTELAEIHAAMQGVRPQPAANIQVAQVGNFQPPAMTAAELTAVAQRG